MRERLGYPLLKTEWTVGEQPPLLEGKPACRLLEHREARRSRRGGDGEEPPLRDRRRGAARRRSSCRRWRTSEPRVTERSRRPRLDARRGPDLRHAAPAGGARRGRGGPQPRRDTRGARPVGQGGLRRGRASPPGRRRSSPRRQGVAVDRLAPGADAQGRVPRRARSRRRAGRRSALLPERARTPRCTASTSGSRMRWGDVEQAFARPLHWIVALFGQEVVPVVFADVKSGRTTLRAPLPRRPAPIELHRARRTTRRRSRRRTWSPTSPSARRACCTEAAAAAKRGRRAAAARMRPWWTR